MASKTPEAFRNAAPRSVDRQRCWRIYASRRSICKKGHGQIGASVPFPPECKEKSLAYQKCNGNRQVTQMAKMLLGKSEGEYEIAHTGRKTCGNLLHYNQGKSPVLT